jgi:trigger factor
METSKLTETMVLKISELEPCRKKAEITIPAETVDNEIKLITKEFASQANLPGFRAGKAPLQMVRKRYQPNIDQELLRQFHISAFEQIRKESKTDPVTMPTPDSEPQPPKAGKEYKFSLTFDAAPDFKLPKYKGIKLKKQEVKVTDKEINAEIDRYRDMYAEFKTVDSPADAGDMLKISFTSDLECPEDALASYKRLVSAEDSWCWLSEPEMLPGIIKGLKGAKAEEEKELKVEFPADFTEPLLAGKKAKYKITVKEVQRRVPLKDDKELCKRLNVEDIKTLKDELKKSKEAQAEQAGTAKLQSEALEVLTKEIGKIDLPPSLLSQSTQMQFRQIANELVKSEADVEDFKKDTEKHQKAAEEAARNRLVNFFIAKAINEAEKIQVEQAEIDAQIRGISAAYGYKEKDLRQQMENSGGFEELHMDLTIAKASKFIVDNADFGAKKAEKAPEKKKETKDEKKTDKKESKKK